MGGAGAAGRSRQEWVNIAKTNKDRAEQGPIALEINKVK
jgi:hypothetical protein